MKLLVGIVTYNSSGTISRCLGAVKQALPENVESTIIVYDNASPDNTIETIKHDHPEIQVLSGFENKGYAFAVNRIHSRVYWDFFMILNPDLYVQKDAIKNAIQYACQNPRADLIGAKLVDINRQPTHSFGDLPTFNMMVYDFSGLRRIFPRRGWSSYKSVTVEKAPFVTGYVTGAFMFITRKAWDKVGFFDEEFFLYFEDTDWAFRLRRAGGRVVVCPSVIATHQSGASFANTPEAAYYKMKVYFTSAYRYLGKHQGEHSKLDAFKQIQQLARFKLLILKIRGRLSSDAAKRQEMILKIHKELESEIRSISTG